MLNQLSQLDWSNPLNYLLTGLLLGIIVLHIIPKIYREVLQRFYTIKYNCYFQQKLNYFIAAKDWEVQLIEEEKKKQTQEKVEEK